METRLVKLIEPSSNKAVTRSWMNGKWGTGSQRVEIFSCKISKFWGSEVLHPACSVSIYLKFTQREIIKCTHRWKCNLLHYNNYSVYESITWSLCTQYVYTIFVSYTLVRLGKKESWEELFSSQRCSVQASRFIDEAFCIPMFCTLWPEIPLQVVCVSPQLENV